MGKKNPSSMYTFIRIASTFGLSVGITIYLFSMVLGGWLDEKLGCAPVFHLILLFVALGMSFGYLFHQVALVGKEEKEARERDEGEDGDRQ